MEYVVELGELSSNVVMFEPGVMDWSLMAESLIVYDPEVEVQEFGERIVPEMEQMEDVEELVMHEPDRVKVKETEDLFDQEISEDESYPNMDLHAEFDANSLIMYDPEVESDECATNNGCEIMSAEYLDDLVVYEPEGLEEEDYGSDWDSASEDWDEAELDFRAESDVKAELDLGSDEASNQVDATDENVDEGRPSRGRKRKIPNQSRDDRKRLCNTNKTHINTRGKMYVETLFDYQFECLCSKNCTQVVPAHDRLRIFSQFWNVGSYGGRCAHLMSCVKEVDKKRSYSKLKLKDRKKSRIYSIYGTIVCQKSLLKTLQISVSRVTVALEKYLRLDTLADLRGKSTGGWNALLPSKRDEVRAHIASFPRYVSHYTRAKTKSKYLSADLNLAKIYDIYRKEYKDPVSQSTYNNIFYKNFNLRFKRPKKDTCQKCDIYAINRKTKVGNDLRVLEELHESHLEQAELLQAQMKSDCKDAMNDPELECLTFDMQKTLQLPKITTGVAYYKRQLNLYNFGIHSGSTGEGYFNLWTEDEASKGTQEVGSCLRAHIEKITKPMKELILWSDSCGGQNRSIKFVLMMMHILHNHKTLESISMRYLLSGHSFLPNDTEFGEAETAMKSKNELYTDEAYMQVMKECRRKKKFTVNRMSPGNFFSVQSLEALITNRKVDLQNNKVSWLDTHEILIEKKHLNIMKMRNKISGAYQTVNLAKLGCELDVKNITLCNLWPTGRLLSKEKIKDLKDLFPLIPEEYRYFYEFLNGVKGADFEDDIDGFGMFIDFDPDPEWVS